MSSRWWRSRSNYDITKYHNPPAQLVGQCQFPPNRSPTYTISSSSVSGVSLNGIMKKLELDLEQAFDLVGYQFSLKEGKVRPTLEHWQTLSAIQELLSGPTCLVRRLMPKIALLTAITKPVHIGGLPHQADTVALYKQLESTLITKKVIPAHSTPS